MFRGIRAVRPGATPGDVATRSGEYAEMTLQRGARILRPRHRPRVPRRTAVGAAFTAGRGGAWCCARHDLHHRADDHEGSRHAKLLPDGWTVVTRTASCRRSGEHTVAVTDTGVEILTRLPGDDNDFRSATHADATARDDELVRRRPPPPRRIRRRARRASTPARTSTACCANAPWRRRAGARGLSDPRRRTRGAGAVRGRRRPRRTVPAFDIDLLVLADDDAQTGASEALAAFFAALWDAARRSATRCSPRRMHRGRGWRYHRAHRDAGGARWPPMRARSNACAKRSRAPCRQRAAPLCRQARGTGDAARALRRHLRQPRAQPQGRAGRPARPADAALDGDARARHHRPEPLIALGQLGAEEHATLEREGALSRLRFRSALSPASARNACASTTEGAGAPRAWTTPTTSRSSR